MREAASEIAELHPLIDRSNAGAERHMAGMIHPGKYSLSLCRS